MHIQTHLCMYTLIQTCTQVDIHACTICLLPLQEILCPDSQFCLPIPRHLLLPKPEDDTKDIPTLEFILLRNRNQMNYYLHDFQK